MYPTRDPGTPDLAFGPGGSPKTWTEPSSNLYLPMIQLSKVVFPHPDGPEIHFRFRLQISDLNFRANFEMQCGITQCLKINQKSLLPDFYIIPFLPNPISLFFSKSTFFKLKRPNKHDKVIEFQIIATVATCCYVLNCYSHEEHE